MKKLLCAVILMLLFISPSATIALSCESFSFEEGFDYYQGVIIGQVDKIFEKSGMTNHLRIKVEESYKGIETNWVMVEEDVSWGDRSKKGEEYIFFLSHQDSQWEHKLCSPSSRVNSVTKENPFFAERETLPLKEVDKPNEPKEISWFLVGAICIFVGLCLLAIRQFSKTLGE